MKRVAPQIEDIRKQFIRHPSNQYKIAVSAGDVVGNAELAWRRGLMQGHSEAYHLLKKKHPEAAAMIKEEWTIYNSQWGGAIL